MDIRYSYQRTATVHQLFVEAAVTYADRRALVGQEGTANYADLLNYAQNVCSRLKADYAVQPGAMVGLAAGRSFATVGAILGILMAGAAYVPLDVASSPESLLVRQLENAGVTAIITDEKTRKNCCSRWSGNAQIIDLPDFSAFSRPLGQIPASLEDGPEAPAYVMFTSGSTGVPKGVVVPHRAITRLVSEQEYMKFGPEERLLLHSPLSFDASTLELWGALLHGASLVVAPDRVLGIEDYKQLIERYQLSTLWMTAAVFHLAAQHSPGMFKPLRQLLVGGDIVQPERVREVMNACPGLQVINGYGPTESTTFALCHRVPQKFDTTMPLPIGKPIRHTEVYVLDEDRRPVAQGKSGELAIGGEGVALGYIGQPELTRRRFINGAPGQAGNRLYLTGDRVRCDSEGVFHFLGRFDREQKIDGKRVDLDEVEAVIAHSPAVRQAATVTIIGEDGKKQLYAIISPAEEGTFSLAELRNYLLLRLPKVCIPIDIIRYHELPLNANGKLDRPLIESIVKNKLTERRPQALSVADPPDVMTAVLVIWGGLLGHEVVDVETNFFDIGGTSLLLMEMHARLNAVYPGAINMMDLFSATTPQKISELISNRDSGEYSGAMSIAV